MLEAKPLSPFVHFVSFALCWPRRGSVSMFEMCQPVKNGRTIKSYLGQVSQLQPVTELDEVKVPAEIRFIGKNQFRLSKAAGIWHPLYRR